VLMPFLDLGEPGMMMAHSLYDMRFELPLVIY